MSWLLLFALLLALALAVLTVWVRRADLHATRSNLDERRRARESGSHRARLQHPFIDLTRCIGCGTCVAACPEDGVLELVHGQAVVVHGGRCVGHGRCAAQCPTGAIALTLADMGERRDIPVLTESFESTRVPGLFLAGEVTGYALVSTAIAHGTAVADEVARRTAGAKVAAPFLRSHSDSDSRGGGVALAEAEPLDLVIVGAGPAGLACALQAKARGLSYVVLEQAELGGTVAKYPRRKLVMTQPVTLPLVGKLTRTSYTKEELVEMWERVAREQALPIRHGEEFVRVEPDPAGDGTLHVHTKNGAVPARHVCLALGRRGTPRKLGVPGEELSKVSYSLLDAHSYRDRRILVVGGGDSAIEAALGLAEQPGNRVAISYRKAQFFRLKARNEQRLTRAHGAGEIEALMSSEVTRITPECVHLRFEDGSTRELDNDEVFVFAGGTPPVEVLEKSGVSFDPADRPAAIPLAERGTGLLQALAVALVLALATAGWVAWNADYYGLATEKRPDHRSHSALQPSGSVGLLLGITAVTLVLCNLAYLARRSGKLAWLRGTLQRWMTAHVATGILALLCALVHSAMAPGHTVGGHALGALAILVTTGAIGRYFYSFVPRAANGRELALDEVRAKLAAISGEWDLGRGSFGEEVRAEIQRLVGDERWHRSFFARVAGLVSSQRRMRALTARLRAHGVHEGIARDHLETLLDLAKKAQRAATMAAHYEDLRAIMATWRWVHRWVALGMVLLLAIHVVTAIRYGNLFE